jgi:transcription-repair coupling factor (superfamily II helicase)
VVSNTLSSNIIFIKNGDTLDTGALLLKLADFGFERTDFVYEPGQFAIRGGILDIYSFGNEKPYRVELFGNEVDSIRIIDPETQLSERKLLQVSIIPNIETQFVDKEKISLLNFLPENMIVWIREEELVYKKLKDCEEELEYFFVNKNANEKAKDNSEQSSQVNFTKADFISSVDLENQIENRSCIFFGDEPVNRTSVFTLQSNTLVQPAFNRRFDLLIQDLKNWEQKGFDVYLFAENPKQLERLRIIFEDLKSNIVFNPITASIHEGFINEDLKIVCYTDHEIFQRYHKYRVKQAYNKSKALTLRTLRELQPGDFVTHIDHGVGTFSGLQKIEVNGRLQEAVRIIYKDSDILYVNINSLHKIAKYTGKEGTVPKVNKLGSDVWNKLKDKTKAKVKEIAFDLIKLYASRKAQQGFQHTPDNYLQTELEASFIYEDTPDQGKATADVKKDMESSSPMDRLVCGDVGFGKTEIAIRAAFKTCIDGKQAAILVPTTILAFQHYKTFSERLKDFPVTVDYINRFKSARKKKKH